MASIEVMKDAKGQFRFRIKANNGEVIATSESYKAKPKAMATIQSLKAGVKGAKVVDLTVAAKPAAKATAKKSAKKAAKPVAAKKAAKAAPAKAAAKPAPAAKPALSAKSSAKKAPKRAATKPAPAVPATESALTVDTAPVATPTVADSVDSTT